jgi:hypothetical protein
MTVASNRGWQYSQPASTPALNTVAVAMALFVMIVFFIVIPPVVV